MTDYELYRDFGIPVECGFAMLYSFTEGLQKLYEEYRAKGGGLCFLVNKHRYIVINEFGHLEIYTYVGDNEIFHDNEILSYMFDERFALVDKEDLHIFQQNRKEGLRR